MSFLRPLLLGAALVLGTGCARTSVPAAPPAEAGPEAAVGFVTVTDSIPPDPAMEALVAPYRTQLDAVVGEVLGTAAVPLTKDGAESTLGNFAADALLAVAATEEPVDFAVTNSGGLRTNLPAGPITVGDLYEVMPFENSLVVLTLTGAEVDSLAQQIAGLGGEPIAGWSFRIDAAERAVDIRVGRQPLDRDRTYRVATIDYLANGGGGLAALWSPQARTDTRLLFREAMMTYVRARSAVGEAIAPTIEGRITAAEPTDG